MRTEPVPEKKFWLRSAASARGEIPSLPFLSAHRVGSALP